MGSRFLNAVFLIAGTAIGAGVIALPLSSANLNFIQILCLMGIGFFVAYQSSCMAIDLSMHVGKGTGIAELSKRLSGKWAFAISIASFYGLSFAVLSAYFAGITDTVESLFEIPRTCITLLCGGGLAAMLLARLKVFDRLNAILFAVLMLALMAITFGIYNFEPSRLVDLKSESKDVFYFIPIVFTSFGVQNICAHICGYLEMDKAKIKRAFKVGILIPAVVYAVWIFTVLMSIQISDISFLSKVREHQVGAGELIEFLCRNTKLTMASGIFKILTFTAMATSAIGIGIGLLDSIRETYIKNKIFATAAVTAIPLLVAIFLPHAFISILSFGAMIATVFVVFIPYFLLHKIDRSQTWKCRFVLCILFATAVVLCELCG
ncbi:MAG: hypothetical protein LBJ69_02860 [Holosporales bacterium]|jgi:tyrosine-specific transport protein|nr:hypothetical protein [Holosporales bacterium]